MVIPQGLLVLWPYQAMKAGMLQLRANLIVMAGLDSAIHEFLCRIRARTWMPGSSPAMTS
jgi:hypothetical protein